MYVCAIFLMLLTLQHTWLLVIIDYFTQAHAIKKNLRHATIQFSPHHNCTFEALIYIYVVKIKS